MKNKFYRSTVSNEVYQVRNIRNGNVTVDHCSRDSALEYTKEAFDSEFKELPEHEAKRAAILSDIIYQLDANNLVAMRGNYARFKMHGKAERDISSILTKPNVEIKDLVQKAEYCSVCVKGAMFVCAVSIHNKLKVKDFYNYSVNSAFVTYLSEWFHYTELDLMERYFESWASSVNANNFREKVCEKHYQNDENHSDSLLREIVANTLFYKTFRPEMGLAP